MSSGARAIGAVQSTDSVGGHYVTLRAIKPGAVDSFGSLWNAHAFDRSCRSRLPTLAWGHSWSEPIGRAVLYTPSDQGPAIRFRLDDFDAVPRARQAYEQVQSGTIDDCSVGFSNARRRDPSDQERRRYPGIREVIEEADLDEVSLVLRGAVPGAKVLAVRSRHASARELAIQASRLPPERHRLMRPIAPPPPWATMRQLEQFADEVLDEFYRSRW